MCEVRYCHSVGQRQNMNDMYRYTYYPSCSQYQKGAAVLIGAQKTCPFLQRATAVHQMQRAVSDRTLSLIQNPRYRAGRVIGVPPPPSGAPVPPREDQMTPETISDAPVSIAAENAVADAAAPSNAVPNPPAVLPDNDTSDNVITLPETEPAAPVDAVSVALAEATGEDTLEPETTQPTNLVSLNVELEVPVTVNLSLESVPLTAQDAIPTSYSVLEPHPEPSLAEDTASTDKQEHKNVAQIIPIGIVPRPVAALVPPLCETIDPPIDREIGGTMQPEQARRNAAPDHCKPEAETCHPCDTIPPNAAAVRHRDAADEGLLCYKEWWYRRNVDVVVRGERLSGMPILIHNHTIRLVNPSYSYFIPLSHVDYIRTDDGYGK
ncbi:MAG: hypothetical protein LUG13_04340 [Oscillospiraceae bacterium]|nr:hypothetical protein [Oscillospiraceae bacterium]